MKRILAILLAMFLLAAVFSGCSATNDPLVGTWTGTIDDTGRINLLLADAYGAALANYLKISEFTVPISMTFRADGTYCQVVDTEGLSHSLEHMKQALGDGLTEYLQDLIDDTGSTLTVEQLMENLGLSLETLLDTAFSADTLASVVQDYTFEGHYKAEDGRLYTSDSLQTAVDEKWYEAYTLSGDTLTLLSLHCQEDGTEADQDRYPLVLTREN